MRNEYETIYNFYEVEIELRSEFAAELNKETALVTKLKSEIVEVHLKAKLKEENENLSKKLKAENRILQVNTGARQGGSCSCVSARKNPEFNPKCIIVGVEGGVQKSFWGGILFFLLLRTP